MPADITAREIAPLAVEEIARELATRQIFPYSSPFRFSLAQLIKALAATGQVTISPTAITIHSLVDDERKTAAADSINRPQ